MESLEPSSQTESLPKKISKTLIIVIIISMYIIRPEIVGLFWGCFLKKSQMEPLT